MAEFGLIERIRARTHVPRGDVLLGIGDDAALLATRPNEALVVATDTMVAGVHFPHDAAAFDIGWKSLAVNLSDLAAMGAAPSHALLALTLPEADAPFIDAFAEGFGALAREFGVALVGGDTTSGPLAVTVTVLGFVPMGEALRRDAARVGDLVCVTGTLGDAAAALYQWRSELPIMEPLAARWHRPAPRVSIGLALRGIARAAIDVSDGFVADLDHICAQSGVGAEIDADALPSSLALREAVDRIQRRRLQLSGGDDYELCFTIPPGAEHALRARIGDAFTIVGRIVAGERVRVLDRDGHEIVLERGGYEHFS